MRPFMTFASFAIVSNVSRETSVHSGHGIAGGSG